MTDADATAGSQAQSRPQPNVSVKAQHIRNLQFDNPGAPSPTVSQPQVNINVRVDAKKHAEGEFLSILHLEATALDGEATIYKLSLTYGGVFRLENVEDRFMEPMLLIECPRILFPFVRRIVADVSRDGGYAPLMLDPIDFTRLYQGELARRAQAQADQQQG